MNNRTLDMVRHAKGRTFLTALLPAAILATGCHTTYHTATPVAKGTTETSVSVGWVPDIDTFVPLPEVAIRTGLTENSDVGVRFYLLGVGADYNYALINAEHFALSFNPEIQFTISGYDVERAPSVNLNLLIDVLKSDDAILTLAAKPGFAFVDIPLVTAGAGALIKLKVNDGLSIAPGADLLWPGDGEPILMVHFGVYYR